MADAVSHKARKDHKDHKDHKEDCSRLSLTPQGSHLQTGELCTGSHGELISPAFIDQF
jgi:hypothetical protein